MKEKLSKITDYLKVEKLRNDRRIIIYLVCLMIATGLWFLNALSKDYSTKLSYPVKYVNLPKNRFIANDPPAEFDLVVHAHGFTLLRHKLNLTFSPIVLNLNRILRNVSDSPEGYRITTSRLISYMSEQVSNEITINSVQPEYFLIKLDSLKSKRISIRADVELQFSPQYNLVKPVQVIPGKVDITGPAAVLDTIDFLYTEKKTYVRLEGRSSKMVNIIHPDNVTVSPGKVALDIPVERFTEKKIVAPVQVMNKPENVSVKLFPSSVELTLLIALSEFDEVSANDFTVYVEYGDITDSAENLAVQVKAKDSGSKVVRFSPELVEFLIETN